jgi:hypothetical protein
MVCLLLVGRRMKREGKGREGKGREGKGVRGFFPKATAGHTLLVVQGMIFMTVSCNSKLI